MGAPVDPSRIALLLSRPGDLRLLRSFLMAQGHEPAPLDVADLVIADGAGFWRHSSAIRAAREASSSILPVLVALEAGRPGEPFLEAGCDDLLRMPLSRLELGARLDVFLRLKRQSEASVERWEQVFLKAGFGVSLVDPAGRHLVCVNEAFARLHERTTEELEGAPLELVLARGAEAGYLAHLERVVRAGHHRAEIVHRRRDGSEFVCLVDTTAHRDFLASSVQDITRRQEVQQELERRAAALHRQNEELEAARRQAEAASRAKDDFLANMSHEIRTPLNGIVGMLHVLDETDPTEEQSDCMAVLRDSADRLLAIVDEILDFSRIGAGELHLERRMYDLKEQLDRCARPLELQARAKGLRMRSSVSRVRLVGDPVRMCQIIGNLLANAIKFTEKGEVALRARIRGDRWLRIEVEDTGIGIPDDKRDSIFEPFRQADDSITRKFGGTGLGLAIARRLAEAMGGRLGVYRRTTGGTRFTLLLPVDRGEATAAPAEPPAADRRDLPRRRVLLVEDNPINQKVTSRLLEKWGQEVLVAENGRQALEICLRQGPFDLVLMDVHMPEMSGLETTERLRTQEDGARTVIVALTARVLPGDEEMCRRAGMDGYLRKPLKPAELRALLRSLEP